MTDHGIPSSECDAGTCDCDGTVPELPAGVQYVYVKPSDVLVIHGLADNFNVDDEHLARLKDVFGVSNVVMIEGPAEFTVTRQGGCDCSCSGGVGDCKSGDVARG